MDDSALMKLPAELREQIYGFAMCHPEGIKIDVTRGIPRLLGDQQRTLSLPSTSKQLHTECTGLLYKVNEFTLITRSAPSEHRRENRIGGDNGQWQAGLRLWLHQIGSQSRACLSHVTIDVGTSYLYRYFPTSESVWRSVSSMLGAFHENTNVRMKTKVDWRRSCVPFTLEVPLRDPVAAKDAVAKVLWEQRVALEIWCREIDLDARATSYHRMELGTCGQELENLVSLIESRNL